MSRTVLLIDHPVGQRDDRASRMLAERGYALHWCSPGKGDSLPDPRDDFCAAVVYGGPESANDGEDKPYIRQEIDWIEKWLAAERPFLGICLGAQMLARALGAPVSLHPDGLYEIGYVPVKPTDSANGFLDEGLHVYHWHKEGFEVPDGAELLALGPTFPNQAFRYGPRIYGIQFHPEVTARVLTRWIREAGHMLVEPGAHSAERQLADTKRFDAPMSRWLDRFFDGWLGVEG
ncbi:MAG: GMP synthase [Kiloniellales bacterium]|jgi:GMP synthase (glutamine-hydrolysing)